MTRIPLISQLKADAYSLYITVLAVVSSSWVGVAVDALCGSEPIFDNRRATY